MHSHFSSTHVEHLRRQAKQFSKTAGIPISKAQDLIAQQNGWENWSLLMKHRLRDDPSATSGFKLQRTPEEFALAMRKFKVEQPRTYINRINPFDEVLKQTEDICNKFVSAKNAIDFAVAYVENLLQVPRFRIQRPSRVDIEMHLWLPYGLLNEGTDGQILLNRSYKPVGLTDEDTWVDYDEFPHLQTRLKDEQLWAMSHPNATTPGFFYYDGDRPWEDRAKAEAYLGRLQIAQSVM